MSIVRLYVSLKVPDNTARSALSALQRRMGYSKLSDLDRSDYWQFDFPGLSEDQARSVVEQFAQKTALFVNPNKHRWSVMTDPSNQNGTSTPLNNAQASVLVCDREDGKAEAVFERLMAREESDRPASLAHGVWWDLHFDGASSGEVKQMAEEMAVAESRRQGLFCNPHYQTHRLFFA